MSYEEEIIVLLAQLALMKKRIYELRQRALNEAKTLPQQRIYSKATDELAHSICGLASTQVRLGIAQYVFASAKAK